MARNLNKILQNKYNLSLKQYNVMLLNQNDSCAGCLRHINEFNRKKVTRFVVDHYHGCCEEAYSCGRCIRGLLCGACNMVLGMVRDNPLILRQLANYLEKPLLNVDF